MNTLPELMTVAEVADLFRVSRMTVYRLIRNGDLAATTLGHSIRVSSWTVTDHLAASGLHLGTDGTVRPSPEPTEMVTRGPLSLVERTELGLTEEPHQVTATIDSDGEEVHECLRCGFVGSSPPPLPCPGPARPIPEETP